MKASEIKIGELYLAKVSGQLRVVRITGECELFGHRGWSVINESTGRTIMIRSPQRLRRLIKAEPTI